MKSMVHISVRHVYLCENPPSPNKVKGTSLDCVFYAVKRRQTRECQTKPDTHLFMLVRRSRQ